MENFWKKIPSSVRIGILCALIGLIAGAGLYSIFSGRQLSDIRKSEAAVTQSIADLERQNQELAGIVANFGAKLDSCTSAVTAVGKQVQLVGGAVQDIGTGVGAIKSDTRQIAAGQSDINAKLSEFGQSISGLGSSIHGLAEPIHSATTGVQQAANELSGSNELIDTASGILQGLPKAGQGGTK